MSIEPESRPIAYFADIEIAFANDKCTETSHRLTVQRGNVLVSIFRHQEGFRADVFSNGTDHDRWLFGIDIETVDDVELALNQGARQA